MILLDSRVCRKCGKPATNAARDIRRTTEPDAQWETYEPRGEVRFGCAEHPADARLYDLEDNLLGRLTDDEGRPIPL